MSPSWKDLAKRALEPYARRTFEPHEFPIWTRADDSDDDDQDTAQAEMTRWRRSYRRKILASRNNHHLDARTDPPPPPGPAPNRPPPPPGLDPNRPPPPPGLDPNRPAPAPPAPSVSSGEESATETLPPTIPRTEAIAKATGAATIGGNVGPVPTFIADAEFALASGTSGAPAPTSTGDSDSEGGDEEEEESGSITAPVTSITTEGAFASLPTSATNGNSPAQSTADRAKQIQHHEEVETALRVVGSVASAAAFILLIWLLWRCFRRRHPSSPSSFSDRPSRTTRMLAHIPFISSSSSPSSSWHNIDHSYMDEKRNMDLLGYMPDAPPAAALNHHHHHRSGSSFSSYEDYGMYPPAGYPPTEDSHTVQLYRSSNSSPGVIQPPRDSYTRSESSLSSAFGNGTHVPPTPAALHHKNGGGDEGGTGAMKRDTVYTQASTATSVPRFRTIDSWVKQQGDRSKNGAVPVPEQRFTLMMSDGEMPRRVG